MQHRWLEIGILCAIGGVFACGSSKPETKDPTDPKPTYDETPKWEGANATPPPPPEDTKPAKSSSGGTVREAPKQRTDQYDKEGTEIAFKRAARQVKENCGHAKDESGKATGPWGKATIMVQLGHNGRSKGVTVPAPYQGKAVGVCVEKSFSNLQFPPWNGADAEVPYEVEIVEPGKEGKK